jgi:hypothetical protein
MAEREIRTLDRTFGPPLTYVFGGLSCSGVFSQFGTRTYNQIYNHEMEQHPETEKARI